MFNLQETLLVMSSWPPLPTSPPPSSQPWLTMRGRNRAVTVPKCLSWAGLPCGDQLFLIHLFCFLLWDGRQFQLCCGLAQTGRGDAGCLLLGKNPLHLQLRPLDGHKKQQYALLKDALGCQRWLKTGSVAMSASLHLSYLDQEVRIQTSS